MIKEKLQTQNNFTELTNFGKSHLSIQVNLDGFAYCIFDKDLVDVVLLKHYEFSERTQNPEQLLANVKEIFENDDILHENYETVNVSHQSSLSTLVPESLYDRDYLKDYLKYSVKVLDNDTITVDDIAGFQTKNVYIPFENVNFYLQEIYGSFNYFHSTTILLNSLLKYFKNSTSKYFFVNVTKHNLELVYINNGEVLLYNTFLYFSKEDFIYYILFVMEQLNLDPNMQPITFIGDIVVDSPNYQICFQYIRYLNFLNINNFSLSEEFYQINPHVQKHNFFELLNQF
jgi:hypothetical protein